MQQYGIIGYPLEHSFSPKIHNTAFEHYHLDAQYNKIEIEQSIFDAKIKELKKGGEWYGFNVTIPHKQNIISYLDELEPICEQIGAVNTVKVNKDGSWKGFNTDYMGFIKPIQSELSKLNNCLLIGAGGAAQAVGFGILKFSSIGRIAVIDRINERAESLVNKLKSFSAKDYDIIDFKMINNIKESFDLIVNMSPVGMGDLKDQAPMSIKTIIKNHTIVYDLIYNPAKTLFLKEAEQLGLRTVNGLPMLIGQAEESFKIWTGRNFPDKLYKQLKDYLS